MKKNYGYTLVELAISTSIIALLAVGALTLAAKKNSATTLRETNHKLEVIDQALKSFIRARNYIPCPALPNLTESEKNFGKSENLVLTSTVTDENIYNSTTKLCSNNGLTHGTGAVPVRTLNLEDEFAYDGWGRKFTFRTANASGNESDFTESTFKGDIRIVDLTGNARTNIDNAAPYNNGALYVIISHGSNGKDVAWRRNYDYPTDDSQNPTTASGIEAQNTLHDGTKTYIQDKQTDQFDDVVIYGTQQQVNQPKLVKSPVNISPLVCNNAQGIVTAGASALATQVNNTTVATTLFGAAKDIAYMCNNAPSGFKNEANPSTIPGLITWLDANDPATLWQDTTCSTTSVSNGTQVGCWKDKSGLSNHALHASANNPIYTTAGLNSLPALSFEGNNSLAIDSQGATTPTSPYILATSTTPYTVFIAGQTSDTGTFISQKGAGSAAEGFFVHALAVPTATLEFNLLGDASASTTYDNEPFVLAVRWDGTDGQYFYGETYPPLTTTTVSTATNGNITLGLNGSGADALTGYISELIIFNRALNDDSVKGVKSYLATKWNIDEGTGNSNCPVGMVYSQTEKNPLRTCHCSNDQEQVVYNTTTISSCFPDNTAIGRCVTVKQTPTYDPGPTISNLELWLDADDCSTVTIDSNQRITEWLDKSDNAYTATAASGHGPIYYTNAIILDNGEKRAVARFDKTNSEYLSVTTSTDSPHADNNLSIYAMVITGDMTERPTIFSTRRNNDNQSLQLEYGSDGGSRTNSVSITGTFSGDDVWVERSANNILVAGVPYIFEYFRSNSSQEMYINSTLQSPTDNNATGNNFDSNTSVKLIGAGKSLGTNYMMDGSLGELLFYNTHHDSSERSRIQTYLSEKWNVATSIPTNPNPGNLSLAPALWLDATLTNSGGAEPSNEQTMTTWKDRRTLSSLSASGAPKYLTNSLNGNPIVQFPSQSSYFYSSNTSTIFDSRNMSISLVYSIQPGGSDRGIFGNYTAGSGLFGYYTSSHTFGAGLIDLDTTTLPTASSSFSGSTDYIISTVIGSSTGPVKIYHNGTWEASGVAGAGSFSTDPFWIGSTYGMSTGSASINIAEFIGYNAKLSIDQRQAVEGYLSAKWGVAVSF
jgi:type II secretory pathway pseudopilin PulG